MAYDKNGLKITSNIGGQETPNQFSYTTEDALVAVATEGYFDDAAETLKVNDLILTVTSTGTTPVHAWNIVNSNAAGVVDITDGDVISATDTA